MPFDQYKEAGGVLPEAVYKQANAASDAFYDATGGKLWDHVRMADREVILRFCAFRTIGEELDEYGPHTAMDDFLTDATEKLDSKLSNKQLGELAMKLDQAMRNAIAIFGQHAFRKWPLETESLNPINRALFESWSVALADYDLAALKPHKAKIVKAARKYMSSDREYIDAISAGTGDHNRVKRRFSVAREILAKALG